MAEDDQQDALVSREMLIAAVKHSQRMLLCGSQGTWKEFLKTHTTGKGKCRADPSCHPDQVLTAFVASLFSKSSSSDKQPKVQLNLLHALLDKCDPAIQQTSEDASNGNSNGATGAGGPSTPSACVAEPLRIKNAWCLVDLTQQHPRFLLDYTLPSSDTGWHRTAGPAPCGRALAPRLYAVDCEMVATSDDSRALASICVVDEEGLSVMDELVRPTGEVTDYKSEITGITAATLKSVITRRGDVASRLAALLAPDADGRTAVLVGHSLHFDLRALRLEHYPVIDTAYLFKYRGAEHLAPSLRDVMRQALGVTAWRQEGGPHSALEDAVAAMQAVRWLLAEGRLPPLLTRTAKVAAAKALNITIAHKLLLHRLPCGLPSSAVQEMLRRAGAPPLAAVEGDLSERRAALVFASVADADAAYDALPGTSGQDCAGRPQKQVVLADGHVVAVRKMLPVMEGAQSSPPHHPSPPDPVHSKRRRS